MASRRGGLFIRDGSRRSIGLPPPAILILLHLALIIVGTFLLKLPISMNIPLDWLEALFTATSAVTVTGHVVVDTGSHFSIFGQVVIAMLIQLGGLGLMVFAVFILSALGLPVGIPHRILLKEDLKQTSISEILHFAAIIIRVVVVCEVVGTGFLALVFVPEQGWATGLWHAVFHAIAAFNNAGFALYPDNLVRFATNPVLNISVPALFIVGGIGFAVINDVIKVREWRRFSLHSKLTLSGTTVLVVWSVLMFAALEWRNPGTLGEYVSPWDKLMISWFQGVTTRTAGFNTIDISEIYESTALMFISLMLVGAGSASTAGGIKVTTFIILLLAIVAFFKRRSSLVAFGRSLGLDQVLKVVALTMLSILFIFVAIFICLLTFQGSFVDLAFEIASAFGTVGLSRGITSDLDPLNQTVLVLMMFVGRVGPLTLGFFLATRRQPAVRYPSASVYLG